MDDNDTSQEDIQWAKWPDAIPSVHEERILSVSCGNTSYNWAFHEGIRKECAPVLYWRTTPLYEDDMSHEDPCEALARHLPTPAFKEIFGAAENPATAAQAAETAATRRIPAISIYVVSTNVEREEQIRFLFRDIPSRIYKLRGTDFFTVEQGLYEEMGVDRAAVLRAAIAFYGKPAMVIDGGTALTYTAAGNDGKIIGGGIGAGLAVKLRSLSDHTGALPSIQASEVIKVIENAIEEKKPLDAFAQDTKEAIIVHALAEMAYTVRGAVKQFIKIVGPAEAKDQSAEEKKTDEAKEEGAFRKVGDEINKERYICVTGGDGYFIEHLLGPDLSHIFNCDMPPLDGFKVVSFNHMVHYGISNVLKEKMMIKKDDSEDNQLRDLIIGQRVAKWFPKEDKDGDVTYRGSVVSICPGATLESDFFYVRYDDGDAEHYDLSQLYEGLEKFAEVGEKPFSSGVIRLRPPPKNAKKHAEKQADAKTAADKIFKKSVKVQAYSEAKQKEAQLQEEEAQKNKGKKRALPEPDNDDDTPLLALATKQKKSKAAAPAARARPAKKLSSRLKEDPKSFIGVRVAKHFPMPDDNGVSKNELFFGTVFKYFDDTAPPMWHVIYDDDDKEDMLLNEMKTALSLYEKVGDQDPKQKKNDVQDKTEDNASSEAPKEQEKEKEKETGEAAAAPAGDSR